MFAEMDSVMDPLLVRSEDFTLEDDLHADWAVLAHTIVKEPSDTEEAGAKVKEVKEKVKEKFPNTNIEDILTEKHITRYTIFFGHYVDSNTNVISNRYLRSTNWDPSQAVDMFLTSVRQFKDFLPFVNAGLPSELDQVWIKRIVRVNSKRDQCGRRVLLFRLGKFPLCLLELY